MGNIVFIGIVFIVLAVLIYRCFQLRNKAVSISVTLSSLDYQAPRAIAHILADIEHNKKKRFDDVAHLFMQQCYDTRDSHSVFAMRDDLLSKLPKETQQEVRRLDLDEWSIYVSFRQQSYEYYIGRYGIFQLHIDRFGEEHKLSLWKAEFHPQYSAQHMDEQVYLPLAHL